MKLNELQWKPTRKSYEYFSEYFINAWEAMFSDGDGKEWLVEFELCFNSGFSGNYTFYPLDNEGYPQVRNVLTSKRSQDWGVIDCIFPRLYWHPIVEAGQKVKQRTLDEGLHELLREYAWETLIDDIETTNYQDADDINTIVNQLLEYNQTFNDI